MGKPIGEGLASAALREARRAAARAVIEREGSASAAARALNVGRRMIRSWLGDGFAVPSGDSEVAAAVRAERDRLVRDAVRRADGFVKRAATMLGVTPQTMKRWMLSVRMYHPTPSLTRPKRRASAVIQP
ncbi:MAG: hypothetical protein KF764_25440 [Labilithrix sp.]|nr:hypothetical protein [Labilithrix sp.]